MELSDIFIAAMESTVTVAAPDKQSFDNLRTSLVRKLRKYNQTQSSFGLPADTYLKASYDKDKNTASFAIVPLENRIRKKSYTVYDI